MNTTNIKYHLLSLKSSLVDNNKINQRELLIKKVSALTTASSTAPCFLYLYIDAPTDNPLDYEPLGNASSYSRTDAQIIGGEPIAVFCVTNGAPETIDLESLRIVLPPQRTLTMAISSDSNLQRAECAVTFIED